MLFTTLAFFLVYLPVVLVGYYLASRLAPPIWAAGWLFLSSVVFYGYWMPEFTLLLLGSIIWNYLVGRQIARQDIGTAARRRAKAWLVAGIGGDLGLLAYFKYAGFFVANLNELLGTTFNLGQIILPIGISFFTFTQIAFLADAYQKGTKEYRFVHYGLFVTYFPHLIAGPVLHHAQMMPQFRENGTYRLNVGNLGAGFFIFAIGLLKKVVIADGMSPYADAVFNAAHGGYQPHLLEAWIGALAYTFQLYFDFSGYSDMAIGLSWMFNVRLPFNFNSPYKALNITDFWRRWHMTLSAFLRDYLYFPLGGNRRGKVRRYVNLMATMVLGGLWHGASWTFVFWGTLHGAYLGINHAFQVILGKRREQICRGALFKGGAWLLTFLATVVAWVFFRAPDFHTALRLLRGLVAWEQWTFLHQISPALWNQGLDPVRGLAWLALLLVAALGLPNSNVLGERLRLRLLGLDARSLFVLGAALSLSAFLVLINATRDSVSAFIYFNF